MVVLSFYLFKFKLEVGKIPWRLALWKISFVLTGSSLLCDISQLSNRALIISRRHCFHALFEQIVRIGIYQIIYQKPLFAIAEVERAVEIDFLQRYFLYLLWANI
jgi:predicted transcriptional regulator